MRFSSVMDDKGALLAAVTLPKFKLRWMKEQERREAIKTLLISECLLSPDSEDEKVSRTLPPEHDLFSSEKYFFSFEEEDLSYSAEAEVNEYFKASGSEMRILTQFPRIKTLSMKFNTATPSSAPVERLFSLANLVLTPRRNRLSSKRFEKLTLMRYNHYFEDKVEP